MGVAFIALVLLFFGGASGALFLLHVFSFVFAPGKASDRYLFEVPKFVFGLSIFV